MKLSQVYLRVASPSRVSKSHPSRPAGLRASPALSPCTQASSPSEPLSGQGPPVTGRHGRPPPGPARAAPQSPLAAERRRRALEPGRHRLCSVPGKEADTAYSARGASARPRGYSESHPSPASEAHPSPASDRISGALGAG